MNRKEIQKISLQYRTLSSQMLKMNSQEEMYCIQQFFDFISETEIIRNYINECKTQEYDFEQIFADKGWRNVLMLPAKQEELVSYGENWIRWDRDCSVDVKVNLSRGTEYGFCRIGFSYSRIEEQDFEKSLKVAYVNEDREIFRFEHDDMLNIDDKKILWAW